MKKSFWLYLFGASLVIDLAGVWLHQQNLVYAGKPLLVISLLFYFFSQTSGITNGLKKLVAGALVFSWAWDVLLMFEREYASFFIYGLVAFLIAHLFYIYFFSSILSREKLRLQWKLVIPVLVYYAALVLILYPSLGQMRWPVLLYGLVISTMFFLALHLPGIMNRPAGRMMMSGAFLFLVSDSILAVNKFYQPFEMAGIFIMITYALAQLFITTGAAGYIRSAKSD